MKILVSSSELSVMRAEDMIMFMSYLFIYL